MLAVEVETPDDVVTVLVALPVRVAMDTPMSWIAGRLAPLELVMSDCGICTEEVGEL